MAASIPLVALLLCVLVFPVCKPHLPAGRLSVFPKGMAVDSSGMIIIVGGRMTADPRVNPRDKTVLMRVDKDGRSLTEIDLGMGRFDRQTRSISVDREDCIITWTLYPTSVTGDDLMLAKHDSKGNLIWDRRWAGPGYETAQFCRVDNDGNVVAVGQSQGYLDLDPGPGTDMSETKGGSGVQFVCELNSKSDYMWGHAWDLWIYDADFDASGNVYLAGSFYRPLDLIPESTALSTGQSSDAGLLMKVNSHGDIDLVKPVGPVMPGVSTEVKLLAVAPDCIYLAGSCGAIIPCSSAPVAAQGTEESSSRQFLCRQDLDGSCVWVKDWPGTGQNIIDIELCPDGDLAVAGGYYPQLLLPGLPPGTDTSSEKHDAFLARLEPGGNIEWVRTWRACATAGIRQISADRDGNLVVLGYYSQSDTPNDLDPGPAFLFKIGGGTYLSKFSPEGDLLWVWTEYPQTESGGD